MFKQYVLASNFERISRRFGMAKMPDQTIYEPSYNIHEDSDTYVITNNQTKEIDTFRYGISGLGKKYPSTTCFIRSEGNRNMNDNPNYTGSKAIFLQPEFKTLIRSQRCLVLADAFVVGDQNPHLVYLRHKKRPFAFAGIWTENSHGEKSFAIITTPANSLLSRLEQKRMPIILPIEYENRWIRLSAQLSEVLNLLCPYPTELMNAYPVSQGVFEEDDISLIQPSGRPVIHEPTTYTRVKRLRQKKDYSEALTLAERAALSEKKQ